ncbi:hypothetical protein [Phaeacidiphilus oryzae]|uniref:hypothetical protein n=1 Tax=Phaeacidiphilus oryzae TaxID=348818 RepID=UPI000B143498|nr:hypothetical protein [Phaeacidiphilus oryzae]
MAYRFAELDLTCAPVLAPAERPRVVGIITLRDLLHARRHDLTEEHHRQRLIPRRPARVGAATGPLPRSASTEPEEPRPV